MNPYLYYPVFIYGVLLLTIICCGKYGSMSYSRIAREPKEFLLPFALSVILSLWIGFRPLSWAFGDTKLYALKFSQMVDIPLFGPPAENSEWIWTKLMYMCSLCMDVSGFFAIVATGYFMATFFAVKRFTSNNVLITLLFFWGSFSFFSYGTNGIRNGLASSIVLLALSYGISKSKDSKIKAIVLSFIAFNIHRSTVLPIASMFAAWFIIRSYKQSYIFWILSIFLSLIAGGAITSFFAGLGFDDRMNIYTNETGDSSSLSGFRFDFLIYSAMPIILGYYVIFKKNIRDHKYEFLLNVYTLSNAFWIMVIRANFSNRFAYLSWFMYPIVLAYPLLKLNIWGNSQGKMLALIMLAQIVFTIIMNYA